MTAAEEHALAHIKAGGFVKHTGFVYLRTVNLAHQVAGKHKHSPNDGMPIIAFGWSGTDSCPGFHSLN